jgi:RNA ligase (TIGR02306 family)
MWRITHFFYRWAWFRAIHHFFFGMPVKAAFPSYVPKTDEERIQNGVVKFTAPRNECYVSEKLEGQSSTYVVMPATGILSKIGFKSKWDYAIYSRQWRVAEDESTSWGRVSKIFEIQKAMEVCADVFFPGGFAIQGEIIGPGIQGNIYQRKTNEFYVFNIWDIERRKYVSFEALLRMCNSLMGIKTVPILNSMFEINHTLEEFLELANGKTALDMETPCLREGIVVRSYDQSLSFKVVSNNYLLQKAKKEIENDKNEEKQASESVVVV